jgi:hypothetical protein
MRLFTGLDLPSAVEWIVGHSEVGEKRGEAIEGVLDRHAEFTMILPHCGSITLSRRRHSFSETIVSIT